MNSNKSKVILELRHLSKSFRSHWTFRHIPAVQDISLKVFEGEVFGFLGHNGAGKTTVIKTILGLISATKGEILFCGQSLKGPKQRSQIGYLPEEAYFYDHLTVRETMVLCATLCGLSGLTRSVKIAQTLNLLGLEKREQQSVRTLSKGLKQRLGLAQAVINEPSLLFLDEPFSGLDPIGRYEVRSIIKELHRKGTAVFISSHILSDIEDLCDRVAIMKQGHLIKTFALADFKSECSSEFILSLGSNNTADATRDVQSIGSKASTISEEKLSGAVRFTLHFITYEDARAALKEAMDSGLYIHSFERKSPNLEEVFIKTVSQ